MQTLDRIVAGGMGGRARVLSFCAEWIAGRVRTESLAHDEAKSMRGLLLRLIEHMTQAEEEARRMQAATLVEALSDLFAFVDAPASALPPNRLSARREP